MTMRSDTNTSTTAAPVTTVWIVQQDSYKFNDNYIVSAMVPGCFYLTEREAQIDAGYMNMQVLFEEWWWFSPPKGTPLTDEWDFDDPEDESPGELLKSVYQMSLDDACLFFADPNNVASLADEAGHHFDANTILYMVCKLPLSGTEPEEDDEGEDDAS